MRAFAARAAENRVAFLPGQACCTDGVSRETHARLNFTHVPLDQVDEGVRRLARAAEKAREKEPADEGFVEGQEPIV